MLVNMVMLEAGVFSLVNCKFSTEGTKINFWTTIKFVLQVCQSTVRASTA